MPLFTNREGGMMKPSSLPEKPKKQTSPLELSCPKCKADQEYIELLDGEDAFYCHKCDSTIYDPVGTQPVQANKESDRAGGS